jgi:pilus assembly protein Flp/PilA
MLLFLPFPARFVHALARKSQRHARVAGQGLVEYALVLVMIAVVVIGIMSSVGRKTSDVFEEMNCTLDGRTMHADNGNGNSNRCR